VEAEAEVLSSLNIQAQLILAHMFLVVAEAEVVRQLEEVLLFTA
jgi:hypothetical protein